MAPALLVLALVSQTPPGTVPVPIETVRKFQPRPMETTDWVLIGTAVGLLAYDIYAARDEDEHTISEQIRHRSRLTPALPFAFGLLMGHVFFKF